MRRTRGGKSLAELIVVITTLGAVMLPLARVMHVMLRGERESMRTAAQSLASARLARALRRDVHAARGAAAPPAAPGEAASLRLELPEDRVVTYSADDGRIDRVVQRGAGEDAPVESRESFTLAAGETRFEVAGDPPLVRLLHTRRKAPMSGRASHAGAPMLQIEAVAGRDHRFAGQGTAEETP